MNYQETLAVIQADERFASLQNFDPELLEQLEYYGNLPRDVVMYCRHIDLNLETEPYFEHVVAYVQERADFEQAIFNVQDKIDYYKLRATL
ncbi:hypothetical protein [Paraburkholderia fungorum]|jgi:hypothetical protein|uniref:hypothetical protein n=1 Tax=Paraburkholderia fungorum TaxID=134537 RepID=UPI000D073CF6|nr:hypothetical protein [Paraburkholderia fungorum]PRZ45344.1 hypothetical protein BX589_13923 [Paraburkholderia fungorum]